MEHSQAYNHNVSEKYCYIYSRGFWTNFTMIYFCIWGYLTNIDSVGIKDVWIGKAVVYPGLLAWPRCLVVKISIYIAFFDVIHSPVVKQWMHDIELKWRGWKSDAKWYRAHWYFGLYVQIIIYWLQCLFFFWLKHCILVFFCNVLDWLCTA